MELVKSWNGPDPWSGTPVIANLGDPLGTHSALHIYSLKLPLL